MTLNVKYVHWILTMKSKSAFKWPTINPFLIYSQTSFLNLIQFFAVWFLSSSYSVLCKCESLLTEVDFRHTRL